MHVDSLDSPNTQDAPDSVDGVALIVKASGEREAFSEEKLLHSLARAGADQAQREAVLDDVRAKLTPGITTKKLYRLAFSALKRRERSLAARYSLKRAVMRLGPSGYPFEHFFSQVLRAHGYKTSVGVTLNGCIQHEIDVVAEADDGRVLVECKYHRSAGRKTDSRVAMYVAARAIDLLGDQLHRGKHQFWLVTNTQFTSDARTFGAHHGLRLISWAYPEMGNLQDLIESSGVHPITCLTSLKRAAVKPLLEQGVVLCRQLDSQALDPLKLTARERKRVEAELDGLLAPQQAAE